MASSSSFISLKESSLTVLLVLAIISQTRGCYTSIFNFGDSQVDSGNLHFVLGLHNPPESGPSTPLSCCDGRTIIDFIVEYFGLPLLPPYFRYRDSAGSSHAFRRGVNFAIVGSTVLDTIYFEDRGIPFLLQNHTLEAQISFFKEMLSSLCPSNSDCSDILKNSLVVMSPIGTNDYFRPFEAGRSIEEVKGLVPLVVGNISSAVKETIELGIESVLVGGLLPTGCMAAFLTTFQTSDKEEYDPLTGCLKWANKFFEYHNEQLQTELDQIRKLYPHAKIFYGDFYNAEMALHLSPKQYGFTEPIKACCGGGEGPYNFIDVREGCGSPRTTPCPDPSKHISWDGIHLSEAANRLTAQLLLEGPYTIPPMNISCNLLPTEEIFPMNAWAIE